MKTFGRERKKEKKLYQKINPIFLIALIFTFFIISIFYNFTLITKASFKNQLNLEKIALLLQDVNPKLSNLTFCFYKIIYDLQNGKYPFTKDNGNFQIILNYIKNNDLPNLKILKPYKNFYNFIQKATYFKNDIINLLKIGNKYILILENIGESRPNGGFYGSYGILKITSSGFDIKIYDSYYPLFVNKVKLPLKEKFLQKLAQRKDIDFISANIWGFSDKDGKNIIKFFKKTFSGEKINGVIFIKSSLFEKLTPQLAKKIYEWQFVNASIDLIRGKKLPFKKAIYLKQVNNFLKKNNFKIIKQLLKNRDKITKNGYIYVYFPNISKKFEKFLEKNNLVFKQKPNCFYFFDYNFGYNKTDRFLEKTIFILSGNKILLSSNKNYICLNKKLLKAFENNSKIKIKISYFLSVPESYIKFIKNLEKKYNIKLTQREKNILSLTSYVKNNGIIYRPLVLTNGKIKTNIYSYYISGNNKGIVIKITDDKNF